MTRRNPQAARGGIVGITYEGRSIAEFVTALRLEGVQIVVDARLVPRCNRRGFSRHALAESLRASGIQYVHYQELGNPEPYQLGFRGSADAEAAELRYREHLAVPAVREVIRDLITVAGSRRVGVMTADVDQDRMQRAVLLDEIHRCRPDRMDIDAEPADHAASPPDPKPLLDRRDRLEREIDALLAEFE